MLNEPQKQTGRSTLAGSALPNPEDRAAEQAARQAIIETGDGR
jgi:hypothetical protein